jgi:hypothetical protein
MSKSTRILLICLAVIFWLLGLIPLVNDFTDILYWLIWIFIVLYSGELQLFSSPSVIVVNSIAFLLALIPIVCWVPWDIAATWYSNHVLKSIQQKKQLSAQAAAKGEEDQEDEDEV